MKRLPTDRQVMRCIFEMYGAEYPGPFDPSGRGENDPYLPINIRHVAGHLKCAPEIIFGRLYFHLNAKYGYKNDNDAGVSFFQLNFRNRGHSIQFPLLTSVLASLDEEHRRQTWTLAISIVALVFSVAGIVAQVVTAK